MLGLDITSKELLYDAKAKVLITMSAMIYKKFDVERYWIFSVSFANANAESTYSRVHSIRFNMHGATACNSRIIGYTF